MQSKERMKKLTSKIKRSKRAEKPTRITNETVAEHRERILAGGRRFKYPVQYTRHRLVWTAIAIGTVLVAIFLTVSWWQLYKAQTTDQFYYRVTRLLPLPVAQVDGESVRYGDYLLYYKSSETYLNTVERANQAQYEGGDNRSLYDFHKAQAMQTAVTDAYAQKLAGEHDITISEDQIDEAFARTTQLSSDGSQISQEVIDRSNEQLLGLTPADSRYIMKNSLLRKEVAYKIDNRARETSDKIKTALAKDKTTAFEELAKRYSEGEASEVQVFVSGWVKKTNPDGGITEAATKLEKGEVTGPIKPLKGDGYYFIRLLETNDQNEVNYQVLMVPLTEFSRRLDALKQSDAVQYYIDVPEVEQQVKN